MRILPWLVLLVVSTSLIVLSVTYGVDSSLRAKEKPSQESCWSGTLAVQMPDYPDMWWVNYGARTDDQVQICGTNLRIGDLMVFPDYSRSIQGLREEVEKLKECVEAKICPSTVRPWWKHEGA